MINSLKELREKTSLEDLDKYYEESLNKNVEEIQSLLKGYNVEISLECANECYEFCKKVLELDQEDLTAISGGRAILGLPEHIAGLISGAIFFLEKIQQFESPAVKNDVHLSLTILQHNRTKQSMDNAFRTDMNAVQQILSRNKYSCAEINKALSLVENIIKLR